MLLGYIWVSSEDDSLYGQQCQALVDAGVREENFYKDIGFSDQQPRPNLYACLRALTASDTLVVWKLERLIDNRSSLLEILKELSQRDAGFNVLAGKGAVIDTSKVSLKTVTEFIAAWIELEEQLMSRAITKGLAASRAQGKKLGAQRKVTPQMLQYAMDTMTSSDATVSSIAKELGITRATLYNYINGDGSPKPEALKLLQELVEPQQE